MSGHALKNAVIVGIINMPTSGRLTRSLPLGHPPRLQQLQLSGLHFAENTTASFQKERAFRR